MVCITLQTIQVKWKKVTIPKVKEYVIESISIFYANKKHRERFSKLDTVQNEDKTTTYVPIVVILPATLGPFFVKRKNVVGVARNCERMVRAKVHRVETVCPHHS